MFRKWSARDRESYGQMLTLIIPIVVQNLFNAAISSADVVMLNSVGQSHISAVSLAVQYSNLLHMLHFGLGSGLSMLCAQYWGKGDLKAIEKIQGIALRFVASASFVMAVLALCIPDLMMTVYTDDPELITIGASYIRIMSVGYLCWGFSEIYLAVLRSVEKVKISTMLNISALSLNIFLNAIFIYGWFGMPKMGAAGVALATTISRAVQLIACFAVSGMQEDVKFKPVAILWKPGVLMKDFLKLSVPALANDMVWGLAFSTYSIIMGHMGSDVVAANSIVEVVRSLGTTFCYALSSASAIYLGKWIGANQLERAREDSRRVLKLTVTAGVIGGLVVLGLSPFVLWFADLSDTAMGYLKIMLFINSYYIMGISVNSVLTCGVFRAGGDSRFGLVCDGINMWCYAVPLGFLNAFVFKLPPMVVYFFLFTDEFTKMPFALRHYRKGKWLKNITRDEI